MEAAPRLACNGVLRGVLVQFARQVFPFFHIAEWMVRWIAVAPAIGLPFAMLVSWFYEWTPPGIEREREIAPNESITGRTGKNSTAIARGLYDLARNCAAPGAC